MTVIDHIAQLEREGYESADMSVKKKRPGKAFKVLRVLKNCTTGAVLYLCVDAKQC